MNYRRAVPYPARYLVAVVMWLLFVSADLLSRILLIPMIPLIGAVSAFGAAHTQETAQLHANLIDFYVKPFARFPRANWRRLLRGFRPNSSSGGTVSGHPVTLKKLPD